MRMQVVGCVELDEHAHVFTVLSNLFDGPVRHTAALHMYNEASVGVGRRLYAHLVFKAGPGFSS